MRNRRRFSIGAVFEIQTKIGLAYAQLTHKDLQMGHLISVFDHIYDQQPTNLSDVVQGDVRFRTFILTDVEYEAGLLCFVGNAPISAANITFPIFRSTARMKGGPKLPWALWDGGIQEKVNRLTPEQKKYPLRELIAGSYLISRIEGGWRPETDWRND